MKVNAARRLAITNIRGEGQDIPIDFAFAVKSSRRLGARKYEDDHDYSRPRSSDSKIQSTDGLSSIKGPESTRRAPGA
jgi:hypothetical protein